MQNFPSEAVKLTDKRNVVRAVIQELKFIAIGSLRFRIQKGEMV